MKKYSIIKVRSMTSKIQSRFFRKLLMAIAFLAVNSQFVFAKVSTPQNCTLGEDSSKCEKVLRIRGTVQGVHGSRIVSLPNASVRVMYDSVMLDGSYSADNGRFTIEVPNSKWDDVSRIELVASAPNYKPNYKKLFLSEIDTSATGLMPGDLDVKYQFIALEPAYKSETFEIVSCSCACYFGSTRMKGSVSTNLTSNTTTFQQSDLQRLNLR